MVEDVQEHLDDGVAWFVAVPSKRVMAARVEDGQGSFPIRAALATLK